jgi:hypothetical protein
MNIVDEEKRKADVLKHFMEQRHDAYDGVPDDVWEAQLKLELMPRSELIEYAINTPPTFTKFHGCEIEDLTRNLHTTDDQGFEGQVMEREDGSRWFCRWFEQDINFNRGELK